MLVHPQFDPVAIHLGPLAIRWYGLMYLAGFIMFLWFGRLRVRQPHNFLRGWTTRDLDDLLFFGVLGVILGGRLGYVLFYKPTYYLSHPLEIFKVWEGGMAFHGGFLGVLVAVWVFARLRNRRWFEVTDFIAPLIPCGLAAGRIGNFINGELWGRPTDLPWGMIFPQAGDNIPRHPSQLYQFAGEGVALFIILWFYSRKPRPTAAVSGAFLLGYGVFRFLAEFTREPDNFLGLLALNFSMGQWLSLPMILAGVIMMVWAYRRAGGARDTARA
ncbi:prolipoprotein diacylglyceryl transferase [Cupriavidus plantarum]|uniref:prolipoprotein diacylglyceryl transferase n=1 Tax=Cupriavidus plantarum TaxID=942865 RepID=UPI001B192224|nr:prolipoprotein diacylglyceryl transferase [Cupriavidus plantarum]CAG2142497.1 Phosphatidylglycerol--prolipoprotein diacylglyceryl transferase [Cupriavidus plantarum]SMR65517.1 Prolipoprotein diacylglyceryl transferase [Cupriavidus plantarum]